MSRAAVTAVFAVVMAIAFAHPAAADSVEPSPVAADAPPGPGMGHVSVSTKPGKIIVVDIVGRTDALGTDGPFANGCLVSLGAHVEDHFVALDNTGSGSTQFGPLDLPSAVISGSCGTHLPPDGSHDSNLNLTAFHEAECPTCATHGVKVHLDGAPITGPQYSRPSPPPTSPTPPQGPNCKKLSDDFAAFPTGSQEALDYLKALPEWAIAPVALGGCSALASAVGAVSQLPGGNPADNQKAFDDSRRQAAIGLCKGTEDAFPFGSEQDQLCPPGEQ